ncbi:tRNA (adenosine(37)-N6)-threonylcarbamoyltransferase complex ATPase subunit type 1 TsaE [Xanthocytophaga agilis]|uniref:tRNA threonylcarbamoyladenosine biosynthesis protein TsaE n=1 Tax=Xanthocytophaga agilis TaxID=3048010 RepID=A0AAE3R8Q5_9BACT|nr:tRNA (adenosine(37)-N6)-threonylcarbamoyltransferase complex ATPase subunit type 1 TsaE [Xanthocytophaga agilis]MDJ1502837.1 tRNA (adenosine(37)-N6)-threonylcarbamoyltransferase complex ATPase subunit type 1 TsaE [Xanthocytophaga agilis]
MFTLKYSSLKELPFIAGFLIKLADEYKVWLLEGEMGAGKTTLVKAVCEKLGVEDTVQSPTFALVNEYLTAKGESCYHFDFYRIKDETEAMDMGIEEYFDSNSYCFVEWSAKIPHLLPAKYLKISINLDAQNGRILELSKHG